MNTIIRQARRSAIIVAVTALVAGVAACGSNGDDAEVVAAWCSNVEELSELLDRPPGEIFGDPVLTGRWERVTDAVDNNAPAGIAEAMTTMNEIDSDTNRISEQERYEVAQAEATAYTREKCDLDIQW